MSLSDREFRPLTMASPRRLVLGKHPLLNADIIVDDEGASIVLVFTKSKSSGGVIDSEDELEDPEELAEQLFQRTEEQELTGVGFELKDGFNRDCMTQGEFQRLVRAKIVKTLEEGGFVAETFPSIDNDEIFVKVTLPRQGQIMLELAERFAYTLPFKFEAYKAAQGLGKFPGGEPMRNHLDEPVPAHAVMTPQLRHLLADFTDIDLVRMVTIRMDIDFHLDEMVGAGVLSRYFVASKFEDVQYLNQEWCHPRRLLALPRNRHEDKIRGYFGEQIAFFFMFFARYVDALLPVALISLVALTRHWLLSLEVGRYVQIAFGGVMLLWGFYFDKWYRRAAERRTQKWGMHEYESAVFLDIVRSEFKREFVGTWNVTFRYLFSVVLTCLVILLFCFIISTMQWLKHRGHLPALFKYEAIITSVVIKVFGHLWGLVAPKLASWQNPRTQKTWDDYLTWILAPVKIFFALWPYFYIAFVKKFTMMACADNVDDAFKLVYKAVGHNGTLIDDNRFPGVYSNHIIEQFSYIGEGGFCIEGCHPIRCVHDRCVTNCNEELSTGLQTFFLTHVLCTTIFLLIPIFLVASSVKKEVQKSQAEKTYSSESEDSTGPVTSFLQVQGKQHEYAPYEYLSWGGSYVEDFLELAIAYALVICFGIATPIITLWAFLGSLVEYRLLAYRMTNVTCRPHPVPTTGIGAWSTIFKAISFLAVGINVAYAVVVMYPARRFELFTQFQIFILFEHVAICIKVALEALIPDMPSDVMRINSYNAFFLRASITRRPLQGAPRSCWLPESAIPFNDAL